MTSNEIAQKYWCGDGGCVIGNPGGQHTNAGCRCLIDLLPNDRVKIRMAIIELRKSLKEAEHLIDLLP